jgi:hypothetical protein
MELIQDEDRAKAERDKRMLKMYKIDIQALGCGQWYE